MILYLTAFALIIGSIIAGALLANEWDNGHTVAGHRVSGFAPLIAFTLAVASAGFLIFGLPALQRAQTGAQTSRSTTALLVLEDKPGIYAYGGDGLFGRFVKYRIPDENGWISTKITYADQTQVFEGDEPTLATRTVTVPAGAFWPWDNDVETAYEITVPADGAEGIIPVKR